MAKHAASADDLEPRGSTGTSPNGHWARICVIVGFNLTLVLAAVLIGALRGRWPSSNTLLVTTYLMPVSAALGLLVACRRIDFSLPALLIFATALRTMPFLPASPLWRLAAVGGIAAGIGLLNAGVTWYGRLSSALWTALVACGLWQVAGAMKSSAGTWPWEAATGAAMGVLVIGAALLGATGLVNPPSLPPMLRSGSRGFAGLAGVWILVGLAMALLAEGGVAQGFAAKPAEIYPLPLAAVALGGGFILRGRWGAVTTVLLTALAHMAWSLLGISHFGNELVNAAVPIAAALVAAPLYLVADALIRDRTGEGAPTGLLT